MGRWKGVRMAVALHPDAPWEIYDLTTDPAEARNLAREHPELKSEFDRIVRLRRPSHDLEWNF
jgi:hypothetical protein